ncbi:MAG: serine/threonine-protein kinase PknK [Deltaproteobacteria bacterium]|nr:MAG: serine/threonine-protein kinase PknK [Deltaproteobacteria bacterium]
MGGAGGGGVATDFDADTDVALDGDERFEVLGRLGRGGMGVVYRVYDRERGAVVALKVLRKVDPVAIYRFKREFRTISEISHPNLVSLYELVNRGDQWMFTMELVDGCDLRSYVRGPDPEPAVATPTATIGDTAPTQARPSAATPARPGVGPLTDEAQFERLRAAALQLARGLVALHRAGHLHRDVKPSNVMVARDGRVVLLDFGIVRDIQPQPGDDVVVGTPAYMAPEQAAGGELSEASDWYSVGVVLFEVLTGRRPAPTATPAADPGVRRGLAAALTRLAPAAPPDLQLLCLDLLERDPALRPSGAEVLERLGDADAPGDSAPMRLAVPPDDAPLIGRDRERAVLRDAFAATRSGAQRTVLVAGESGMGKTALVRAFLREVGREDRAIVLAGRCYERESVPHKAVDSLVDALAQRLLALPPSDVRDVVPPDAGALAKLFPVLSRVPVFSRALRRIPAVMDVAVMRRKAFSAFRELLTRLARRGPLVLYIDDVQWGDADSAALLVDVIQPPAPPPVLLIVSFRAEEADQSAFLRALAKAPVSPTIVQVPPLSPDDARALAAALAERGGGLPGAVDVAGIARESGGSPFFVGELVRHMLEVRGGPAAAVFSGVERGVSLRDVLGARLADLEDTHRRLLAAIAVAGEPIPQAVARRAAGVGDSAAVALVELRNRHLVRTRGPRDDDAVETYHDRVREAVVGALSVTDRRALHRELALALERAGADAETLARHWAGAGERERAARLCVVAADAAAESLAFDRAAALLRRAIELRPLAGADGAALYDKLGTYLANAGRGAEASDAFLAATRGVDEQTAVDYRLRAAEQALRAGSIEQGMELLRGVMESIGDRLPRTRRGALFRLAQARLRLRLRGLDFEERPADQVDPVARRRLEIAWTAASALAMCDPVLGAYFQARHLVSALEQGAPGHASCALSIEACYASLRGFKTRARAELIASRGREIAERLGDPKALMWADAAEGLIAFATEQWRRSLSCIERCEQIVRDRLPGSAYELHGAMMFRVFALFYLGSAAELARSVPERLQEARDRGDAYAVMNLSSGLANVAWLVVDEPDTARDLAEQTRRGLRHDGFYLQHYWDLFARCQIRLYQGYGEAAWREIEQRWNALRASRLLSIHMVRLEALHLRARCAVAAAAAGDPAAIRTATAAARQLERAGTRCSRALAALVRAGLADVAGDADAAVRALRDAIGRCRSADLPGYEAAAARRLGALLGGDEGRDYAERAQRWFRRERIANPERFAALLLPPGR